MSLHSSGLLTQIAANHCSQPARRRRILKAYLGGQAKLAEQAIVKCALRLVIPKRKQLVNRIVSGRPIGPRRRVSHPYRATLRRKLFSVGDFRRLNDDFEFSVDRRAVSSARITMCFDSTSHGSPVTERASDENSLFNLFQFGELVELRDVDHEQSLRTLIEQELQTEPQTADAVLFMFQAKSLNGLVTYKGSYFGTH